jgi:hypothetical protein
MGGQHFTSRFREQRGFFARFWADEGHAAGTGKTLLIVLLATELRGFLIAGPALYIIAKNGGPLVMAWVVFCVVVGFGATFAVARWANRAAG